MVSILVAYGSGEGQTEKVADYVGEKLMERGHEATVRRVADEPDIDVSAFDAVLVGSPVNNRRHLPAVVEFVEKNREELASRPNGFFQLSLASIVPLRWAQSGAQEYVDDFVSNTGWHPDHVGRFAGAVTYSQYDPLERVLFKLVSAVTTGDTDTSRDYEYTDWDDVEAFAEAFANDVDARVTSRGAEKGETPGVKRASQVVAGAVLLVGAAGLAYWVAARRFTPAEC
ncbi:protoporphyrinogen oxidase [Haloferax sp. MBLA0076]|uniref:Protoporphyrinogen oxidase n=1 Tax=Haloferax litoreum TaxID=2666140 RepID=A0A6A8GIA1_9EURY|nr:MULTISPECIES: flavodoxin domain-containing protein [Haloferax]KAB1193349.1 protoporphyrinogen oxidase [Haloferax sp. CBA1148]MRX21857.1 protoporphyrinogen oxidase [Haloferax litoreum]